jgi:Ribonuclease G/E
MRECYKTRNFAYLDGLIEEAQSMADRMESSLYDKNDYERVIKQTKEAQATLKELIDEIEKLNPEKAKKLRGDRSWLS